MRDYSTVVTLLYDCIIKKCLLLCEPAHMSIWRLYHIDRSLPEPQSLSLRLKYIERFRTRNGILVVDAKKAFFPTAQQVN